MIEEMSEHKTSSNYSSGGLTDETVISSSPHDPEQLANLKETSKSNNSQVQ